MDTSGIKNFPLDAVMARPLVTVAGGRTKNLTEVSLGKKKRIEYANNHYRYLFEKLILKESVFNSLGFARRETAAMTSQAAKPGCYYLWPETS